MVRLADLHPEEAEGMRAGIARIHDRVQYERAPSLEPKPLADSRIALVTSSAIHHCDDPAFRPMEHGFRTIPADVDFADLAQSHVSANFDRAGFQLDPNVVFPLERLRELGEQGVIGSVANRHYSFVGAQAELNHLESAGLEMGRLMKDEGVDAALLVPV